MAAKKKAKASKRMNKTAFIRGFGPDVPANEIVAKGKAQGLDLTKKFIWTKQSEMRKEQGSPVRGAAPSTSGVPAVSKAGGRTGRRAPAKGPSELNGTRSTGGAAQRMKALIIELGTERADELYRDVRAQLNAIAQA
jgi:hypothetical protein